MHKQLKSIYIYLDTSISMLINSYMLLYAYIYTYIGEFWLAFGCILHYCPPLARSVTHNSMGAMQNYQKKLKCWLDITAINISIAS